MTHHFAVKYAARVSRGKSILHHTFYGNEQVDHYQLNLLALPNEIVYQYQLIELAFKLQAYR